MHLALILPGLLLWVCVHTAQAQDSKTQPNEYIQNKVNLAARQRMLSQRIGRTACLATVGLAPETNLMDMDEAHGLFSRVQVKLRDGSTQDRWLPETDKGVLAGLSEVDETWRTFGQSVSELSRATSADKRLALLAPILETSIPILVEMDHVVMLIEAKYEGSKVHRPGLPNAINVSGRQRMLWQKMNKELCALVAEVDPATARIFLAGTVALFESGHDELVRKLSSLKLTPLEEQSLGNGLTAVWSRWQTVRPLFARAIEGGVTPSADLARLATVVPTYAAELDAIVEAYERLN